MKEPHRKGVANRSNPESCAGGGNIAGEALTGAHAGQPLDHVCPELLRASYFELKRSAAPGG